MAKGTSADQNPNVIRDEVMRVNSLQLEDSADLSGGGGGPEAFDAVRYAQKV